MSVNYVDKIVQRILENTNTSSNVGTIIASPSNEPNYKFHWIRDSALVMRTIVDIYKTHQDPKYFFYIINYLENETKLQNTNSLAGLGEPKFNLNGTPYTKPWGRPQNDGPALRGIVLFELIDLFQYKYQTLVEKMIIPIIKKDLNYILENYNKISFDIWEENEGWHFYTRLVQLKFLKDSIKYKSYLDITDIDKLESTYNNLKLSINDHFDNNNTIISSFNKEGKIIKYDDAANILAYCHINYDNDILKIFPLEKIENTCNNLLNYFRRKYNNNDINLIGRYNDDKYYNGEIWVLCSLALGQIYVQLYKNRNISKDRSPMHRSKSATKLNCIEIANEILQCILTLDENLILPEQFNPNTNEFISAKKLTWNYSELYQLIKILN